MNEVYRYGSAYPLYPTYAYMLPPEPGVYYAQQDRQREAYDDTLINWDEAYYLEGESSEQGDSIPTSGRTISQQVMEQTDTEDAFGGNSTGYSRYA